MSILTLDNTVLNNDWIVDIVKIQITVKQCIWCQSMSGLTYISMIPILTDINSASNVGWCPVLSYPDECSGHHEPLPCWCASNLLLHRFHLTAFSHSHLPLPRNFTWSFCCHAHHWCSPLRFHQEYGTVGDGWTGLMQGSAFKDWSESGFASSSQPTFPGGPDVASSQMSYPDLFCFNQTSFHKVNLWSASPIQHQLRQELFSTYVQENLVVRNRNESLCSQGIWLFRSETDFVHNLLIHTPFIWANHCLGMVEEAVDEQQGIQPLLDEKGPRHGFMGNGFRRPAAQIVYVYITGIFLDLEYSLHFFNLAESLQWLPVRFRRTEAVQNVMNKYSFPIASLQLVSECSFFKCSSYYLVSGFEQSRRFLAVWSFQQQCHSSRYRLAGHLWPWNSRRVAIAIPTVLSLPFYRLSFGWVSSCLFLSLYVLKKNWQCVYNFKKKNWHPCPSCLARMYYIKCLSLQFCISCWLVNYVHTFYGFSSLVCWCSDMHKWSYVVNLALK